MARPLYTSMLPKTSHLLSQSTCQSSQILATTVKSVMTRQKKKGKFFHYVMLYNAKYTCIVLLREIAFRNGIKKPINTGNSLEYILTVLF